MLRLIFLSVFVLCCAFSAAGKAMLLNPYGNGNDCWQGSNVTSKSYLKARISYLCPAKIANQENGNSKFMHSLQRISKSAGEAVIESGNYVRKTCLSISYDGDWIDNVSTNHIDSNYPDIVYAYSTGNDVDGYDVYYWVSDDLSPNPSDDDDNIRPLLSGNAQQLFQQGTGGGFTSHLVSLDLSGWDFKEVTNMSQFLAGNTILTDVTFGSTVDLMNVTNISQMFDPSKQPEPNQNKDAHFILETGKFKELISTFVIDDSKLTDRNAKARDYATEYVTTANNIQYKISGNGAFDKRTDGITTMMIRNLDASLDRTIINFCWDIVFENETVRSYTVECIDDGEDWSTKIDLLSEDDCYLIKDNVKLYRGSYSIVNREAFENKTKKFRLRIQYTDNSIGYSDPFDLFCDGELMPITLSSYTLSSRDNTVTLSWTTESETNNDYFTVYASNDGVNFTEISRVDGAGTTSTSHSYSLTFDASSIKYIYLSQTDFDGHTESFEIKSVVSAANLHKTFKYGPLNFRVVDNRLEYHAVDNR